MKTNLQNLSRRALLRGAGIASLAMLTRPLWGKALTAQTRVAAIIAAPVAAVPTDERDPQWAKATERTVPLQPQNLIVPRLREAGANELTIRALYDSERIGFLVQWKDAHPNTDMGTVMTYRDAVALQFPQNPAAGPTSIMMGQRGRGVVVYHWKSDWQFGPEKDVDEAYPNMFGDWYQESGVPAGEIPEASDYLTKGRKEFLTAAAVGNALADPLVQQNIGPVQKMQAEGFGTIEHDQTQDGKGLGVWTDGEWRIVFSIPRRQDKFVWNVGDLIPVAFAVWDGSRDERNGQKAFSQWNDLELASPTTEVAPIVIAPLQEKRGGNLLAPVLGGVGGAVAVGLAALMFLRMRRAKSGFQNGSAEHSS